MEMVDIVLSSYNGEAYISEQIDSILKNTYQQWRLFVCDDGSTDKTGEIVTKYEKEYEGKIFWKPNKNNRGCMRSFLEGAINCEADYIMFCDQDDYWLPNKIEVTLKAMKMEESKHKKDYPVVVFTDACVVNQTLDVKKGSFHELGKLDTTKVDLPHMLMENKMMGCTMMFNKAVKEKMIKMPEHARMHDWWIGLIGACFGKIVYVNEQTLLYRQHEKNVVGSQKFNFKAIIEKAKGVQDIRKVLKDTWLQAKEFYEMYEGELEGKSYEVIKDFSRLYKVGWIKRRVLLLKHGFFKSGVVRNIGLLFIG